MTSPQTSWFDCTASQAQTAGTALLFCAVIVDTISCNWRNCSDATELSLYQSGTLSSWLFFFHCIYLVAFGDRLMRLKLPQWLTVLTPNWVVFEKWTFRKQSHEEIVGHIRHPLLPVYTPSGKTQGEVIFSQSSYVHPSKAFLYQTFHLA